MSDDTTPPAATPELEPAEAPRPATPAGPASGAPFADVAAELERIGGLDATDRAAAAEALEARLRASLDELSKA